MALRTVPYLDVAIAARGPCDESTIRLATSDRMMRGAGRWVLAAAILGSSMAFIDGTVVNVALPALQSALQATLAQVQWVVECYALTLAAGLLTGGSLGDLYGRRRIFAIGVLIFSIASAWGPGGLSEDRATGCARRSARGRRDETIGQFYEAIRAGPCTLCADLGEQ